MGIGHHITIGREDKARAYAAWLLFITLATLGSTPTRHLGHGQAKATEELQHVLIHAQPFSPFAGDFLQRTDIDHGGADLVDQISEIGQAPRCCCALGMRRGHGQHGGTRQSRYSHGAGHCTGCCGC